MAVVIDRSSAAAWDKLAIAYGRLGDIKHVSAAYKRFLELEPYGANADDVRRRLAALPK
jgi:Tfp pilus assembly protein PilF